MTSPHEEYLAGRQKWEHEDHLINQRLTWLLNSQSLLFAAYALALHSTTVAKVDPRIYKVLNTLPLVGIASSALILMGIIAATEAMRVLKKSKRFTYDVRSRTTWCGLAPAYLLPILFIVGWCLVR